ncbi:hypothetical protein GGE43_005326 [Agrobacterium tumefaciens]|uniref:Uncharacterized protein n=1 Tax=Agrobacterium radiobacter TaxID=362 RepID=A0ABR6JF02_AGRRD|nr:hypothetical protein [Agrobacterium radiobacter]MBB4321554.1 hypothetical protein [Agrobacterium radiobacter]MBB4338594.1 hypothetical protein [Agrobacterium radiobacter]MBB4493482.1 hypothetical protein [Agrobacterium radiobacter]MBB4498753.1 hypothetical protein [Agrobacterium radiobacter]MBB4503780.1 hypothetical protein [Agrobacterium radiobacter]
MRQTKRKRRVQDMLAQSQPPGAALLNEICCRYLEAELPREGSAKTDRRKSFNRTVLSDGAGLNIHYLADQRYIYEELTAGIFARWTIWELLDQRYLSGFPHPDEIVLAVGKDACAAFSVLRDEQFAVIGPATFMKNIIVVGDRALGPSDFSTLSEIPWTLWCFSEEGVSNDPHCPVAKLSRLPYTIDFTRKSKVSTARKRITFG